MTPVHMHAAHIADGTPTNRHHSIKTIIRATAANSTVGQDHSKSLQQMLSGLRHNGLRLCGFTATADGYVTKGDLWRT